MKRCPSCNQTFEEDWLSFCTQDGTTLIDDPIQAQSELPAAVGASSSSPPAKQDEQATWNMPAAEIEPSTPQLPKRAPIEPVWQPPPPPTYVPAPSRNLATAAMVLGIVSATVGWLCFGPIPGIAAIILGAVALSQMKKNPDRFAGKQAAWIGIITGGLTVVIYTGLMVVYIIALVAGMNR